MATRVILTLDSQLPPDVLDSCRQACLDLADYLGEPILLATLESELVDDMRAWTYLKTQGQGLEGVEPGMGAAPPVSAAPMAAAPFVYRDDGRPDWGAMWGTFCELALYGGPPHRGEDSALLAPDAANGDFELNEMIAEMRRGIMETTGLYSEPAPPSWMAVTCHSKRMAAWMAAAIILENVDARCEDEILYVPCGRDFELQNQVKSVITVVAKVNHYWQAHIAEQESRAAAMASQ
jgi:hypothetical protein